MTSISTYYLTAHAPAPRRHRRMTETQRVNAAILCIGLPLLSIIGVMWGAGIL